MINLYKKIRFREDFQIMAQRNIYTDEFIKEIFTYEEYREGKIRALFYFDDYCNLERMYDSGYVIYLG